MNRIGRTNIISFILFSIGVILCIFPSVSNCFVKKKQVEVMESEREALVGILEIPKIDVRLPIYPDVEEEMLQNGVGHLRNSNLPGEGKNTHSLIAGHRGLPSASLLTHLDEVKEGECFFIIAEEEKYQYRVVEIQVIRPEETECLKVRNGKELVSVITCTPYGINTHRLVVTGERIH